MRTSRDLWGLASGLAVTTVAAAAHAQLTPSAPETLAVGEWQLAPVAEVRARGEYRHDVDSVDRAMVIERARLGLDATRGPLEARIVLQDARAIDLTAGGAFAEGPAAQALTGAYEAWVEAHTPSTHPSFVRIGRQAVVWGEGRLLGAADWSPGARSLDAVRARLAIDDAAVEALAALVEAPSSTAFATVADAVLLGARGQWAFDPLFAVEAYGLARLAFENVPPSGVVDASSAKGQTLTGALRLHGDRAPWAWGVEGAYQFGDADSIPRPGRAPFTGRRAAWAAAAHVARTFDGVAWSPVFGVGAAYATGDSGGGTYRAFDPLLPDVHAWHGAMDLFAWSNEEEANARLVASPWAGQAILEYRYARMTQPGDAWRSAYLVALGSAPGNTKGDLGHEVDAALTWTPWTPVGLDAGYSVLLLGSGARAVLSASGAVAHLAYLQARVSF